MNPYDFVPVDFDEFPAPERHKPLGHNVFAPDSKSGSLTARITAETPIFIKRGSTRYFQTNKQGDYIIPGTSLKGLFRSLVETVEHGCFGGKVPGMRDMFPSGSDSYKQCTDTNNLCIACRMFGMLEPYKRKDGECSVYMGKVAFQDAIVEKDVNHPPIHTIDLMPQHPEHAAFYRIDGDHRKPIAGRKFYFHHPQQVQVQSRQQNYGSDIEPLGTGSEFSFTVDFTNLEPVEWHALLYAIVLEPGMRHKIGYAKPMGLGSIRIEVEKIRFVDYARRYTDPNRGINDLTGPDLANRIAADVDGYVNNNYSVTLGELRRIWGWDPNNTTSYGYPSNDWFKKNPRTPISQTP